MFLLEKNPRFQEIILKFRKELDSSMNSATESECGRIFLSRNILYAYAVDIRRNQCVKCTGWPDRVAKFRKRSLGATWSAGNFTIGSYVTVYMAIKSGPIIFVLNWH